MRFATPACLFHLLGVLVTIGPHITVGQKVTRNQGVVISVVKNAKGLDCSVCRTNKCSESLYNTSSENLTFTCPNPQDIYIVKIMNVIDCMGVSCKIETGMKESSLFPKFNRTFIWDVKVLPGRAIRLDFPSAGLRQVLPPMGCPDQSMYTVTVRQVTWDTAVGTFCPNGTISAILVPSKGKVTLEVPGQRRLDLPLFSISDELEIKTLAQFEVDFPNGSSVSEFFSPKYPAHFPDGDLMWSFSVPPKHYSTVQFVSRNATKCPGKAVTVEYQYESNISVEKNLMDPQPSQRQGNFNMYLKNCKRDKNLNFTGTSLGFKVSVVPADLPASPVQGHSEPGLLPWKRSAEVQCSVDLTKEVGLSIHIMKTKPKSDCVIKEGSVPVVEVTLPAGKLTKLTFQNCLDRELSLRINRTIECRHLRECTGPVALTVPSLPLCLPQAVRSITWHLRTPTGGALELVPSAGSMQQMLPGFSCNSSFTLHVAEDDGFPVGHFCPRGAVRRIQTHSGVSVTATATGDNSLSSDQRSFFNITFRGKISESYIFSVSPQEGIPVLLATPGWPEGMRSDFTASWITTVPRGLQANLLFMNVNQPKCADGHTSISVKVAGSLAAMFSQREDEDPINSLSVPESFYLNVSNCQLERDHFSVLSKVVVQPQSAPVLAIALGAVGAVLLLAAVALVAICLVIRKRQKQQSSHQVSIYNPNGNTFPPGHPKFPKSRVDNESHVYASIDDTMVYTHLLRDEGRHGPQVDVYRSFTGPMGSDYITTETPLDAPEVDVYRPFVPLADNTQPVPNKCVNHNMEDSNVLIIKEQHNPPGVLSSTNQDPDPEPKLEETT